MKKNQIILIIISFLFSCLCSFEIYGQSQFSSLTEFDQSTGSILIAKAKKKKKKKKSKKSKKSKKAKTEEASGTTESASSSSSSKGTSSTKDPNSFMGLSVGYLAKNLSIGQVFADFKMSFGSFFPYVDFSYTMGSGEYFSIMNVGGGLLYSIPIGTSLQLLGGAGVSVGMWSKAETADDSELFAEDAEAIDSCMFIYAEPRLEVVYHFTKLLAANLELGALVVVSEGTSLVEEAQKFVSTGFYLGAGAMITF